MAKTRKTALALIVELYAYRDDVPVAAKAPPLKWRWRVRDRRSTKIIGASTEDYKRKIDAVANVTRLTRLAPPLMLPGRQFYSWVVNR